MGHNPTRNNTAVGGQHLGQGSYGEVVARNGQAVKKFSKLSHLVQEYVALRYLQDCQYVVRPISIDVDSLELSMELYDCSLRRWLEDNRCRDHSNLVKALQLKKMTAQVNVNGDNLNDFLGVRKYDYGRAEKKNQVGQVVGLAWTL